MKTLAEELADIAVALNPQPSRPDQLN